MPRGHIRYEQEASHTNIVEMSAVFGSRGPDGAEAAPEPPPPATVAEAVREAAARCGNLVFLDDAFAAGGALRAGHGPRGARAAGRVSGKAREIKDALAEGEIFRQRALVKARRQEPGWAEIRADFDTAVAVFERIEARPYLAGLRDHPAGRAEGG